MNRTALEALQETLAEALMFANAPIQGGKMAKLREFIQKANRECAAAIEERDAAKVVGPDAPERQVVPNP